MEWFVDDDNDNVNLLVEYMLSCPCPSLSHKDSYYIFIPSDCEFIGADAGALVRVLSMIHGCAARPATDDGSCVLSTDHSCRCVIIII